MARMPDVLTLDEERELFEELMERPLGAEPPGRHVVTWFGDDGDEELVGEVPSLHEAMRLLARFLSHEGFLDEEAETTTSGPLSHDEADALAEMLLEGSMDVVTSLERCRYLGDAARQLPELDLVVAWEGVPPTQDFALGIYRLTSGPTRGAN